MEHEHLESKISTVRAIIAIAVCKLLRKGLRIAGHGGTNLPGKVALRLCPNILTLTAAGIRTVIVSGTNGKTTTCRLIEQGLQASGISLFSNRSGANLLAGIITEYGVCLLKSAEVVIVFPQRLVVKCQNQSNTPQQGGATGKGLIYSVVIADNPGLDSLVQPRAFDGSAASVMVLRAIPAVHILRCVLIISNMHVGLLFWA